MFRLKHNPISCIVDHIVEKLFVQDQSISFSPALIFSWYTMLSLMTCSFHMHEDIKPSNLVMVKGEQQEANASTMEIGVTARLSQGQSLVRHCVLQRFSTNDSHCTTAHWQWN